MKEIIKFVTKRIIYSLFILLGISILIFFILRIMPGDPVRMMLGPSTPEEVIERYRVAMHLDEPLHIQYLYWFKDCIHGDLGISLVTKHPVLEDIKQRFPATFELSLFAFIFTVIMGIILGIMSTKYSDTWIDSISRIITYIGVVTPKFVFAVIGMLIFAYYLNLLPTMGRLSPELTAPLKITGLITIDALIQGNFIAFLDALKHLLIPSISLGLGGMSQVARILRTSMYGNLRKDYILFEKSFGISDKFIITRFLLKPSINPAISIFGLMFATILANAFIIEEIFNWPGFARYGLNAMLEKDLNAISAVVLVISIFVMIGNIIVDIVIGVIDPRVILMHESKK